MSGAKRSNGAQRQPPAAQPPTSVRLDLVSFVSAGAVCALTVSGAAAQRWRISRWPCTHLRALVPVQPLPPVVVVSMLPLVLLRGGTRAVTRCETGLVPGVAA